jgi:hypothetical protein
MKEWKPDLVCWDCGATNDPGASECWLCHRRDWRQSPGSLATKPVSQPSKALLTRSIWWGWMVLIAIIAVTFYSEPGLVLSILSSPGMGILLLILSVVLAVIITEIRASRRRRQGLPMSGFDAVASIVLLTILIPSLVMVAFVIALFLICTVAPRARPGAQAHGAVGRLPDRSLPRLHGGAS